MVEVVVVRILMIFMSITKKQRLSISFQWGKEFGSIISSLRESLVKRVERYIADIQPDSFGDTLAQTGFSTGGTSGDSDE